MRFLALLLALFLTACGEPISTDAAGVPLAFGLTSFSSKSVALAKFNDYRTEVIENSALSAGDTRPPFSIYTVRVLNVMDGEFRGQLRLEFFNDRLMGVWFYPDNVASYQSHMEPDKAPPSASSQVETWTAKDHWGNWYIAWEDKRLANQRSDWVDRYAQASGWEFRHWA